MLFPLPDAKQLFFYQFVAITGSVVMSSAVCVSVRKFFKHYWRFWRCARWKDFSRFFKLVFEKCWLHWMWCVVSRTDDWGRSRWRCELLSDERGNAVANGESSVIVCFDCCGLHIFWTSCVPSWCHQIIEPICGLCCLLYFTISK